jgi:flagellar assembly protein FliH
MGMCSETLQFGKRVKDVRFSDGLRLDPELAPEPKSAEEDLAHIARVQADQAARERLDGERAELFELQNGVMKALSRALPQMAQEAEKGLIALALEAVDKLLAGLPVTPELVEATVREALRQVQDGAAVSVLLHPEDLGLLQRVHSKLLPRNDGEARVRFCTSPEVTRGGCIVQSPFGVIDARRETKSALLKKSLFE